MDFNDEQLEVFESIIDKHGSELKITTYVDPDALVISDGAETIRVSQGKGENEMFVEANGKTNIVTTTADDRVTAMEVGLKKLQREYDGFLQETALNL